MKNILHEKPNIKNFYKNLLNLDDFLLGRAYRMFKNSTSCIVPIFRTKGYSREYILFEELDSSSYTIKDSGSIDKITFHNKSNYTVFIRAGTIFKGDNTQTRGSVSSMVCKSGETIDISVKCIHESSPINEGSEFSFGGTTPSYVTCSLLSRTNQSSVWQTIRSTTDTSSYFHTGSLYTSPRYTSRVNSIDSTRAKFGFDDLYTKTKLLKESSEVKELLRQTPCLEGQVGIIVLNETGLHSVEIFDNPESWSSFHESIIISYSELLTHQRQEHLFEVTFREDLIPKLFKSFITKIINTPATRTEHNESVRFETSTKSTFSELVLFNNKIIHFIGYKELG